MTFLTLYAALVAGDLVWRGNGRPNLANIASRLAKRLAAIPGTYYPADFPDLVGALFPDFPELYLDETFPAPAGCAWVTDALGGVDLVVQTTGAEVTRRLVRNGRIRGLSGVANVWVHDNIVKGGPTPQGTNENPYGLVIGSFTGGTGWVVEDNTLIWDVSKRTVDSYGIHLRSGIARRNDIAGCVDGINLYDDNCGAYANWVHDSQWYQNDPRQTDYAHTDALQCGGGTNIDIIGNDLWGAFALGTSALILTQDVKRYDGLRVRKNRLRGGRDFAVVAPEKNKGGFLNFSYIDNAHGRESNQGKAGNGVAIFKALTFDTMTTSGSTFTDGTAMTLRRDNSAT